jgi:hypothetical protein
MKIRLWVVLLILLTIFPGCSQVKEYADIAKDGAVSKAYLDCLGKWTRDRTVYSQFETRAHITVTYKSGEFDTSYLDEYSRIYGLTAEETRQKIEAVGGRGGDFTEFFFYAYTPEKDSNDFARSNSIWKVFITDGTGEKRYPVEIREIEDVTPVVEALFPYVKKYYGKFYSLKFPLMSPLFEDQKATLVFTGVLGKVELSWGGAG